MALRAFHHAFLVTDLEATRRFYVDVLGCREGRSAPTWIDFEMHGNQLSCHLGTPATSSCTGLVDGIVVPMPHFGVILDRGEYDALLARVTAAGVSFIVSPRTRYGGEPGEHETMFFLDPSGNAIEIKAFRRADEVFAR
jgi:extradiol dioxygenase family protein